MLKTNEVKDRVIVQYNLLSANLPLFTERKKRFYTLHGNQLKHSSFQRVTYLNQFVYQGGTVIL